ncbi:hypothetical protein D3C78_819470 [compost metagenome]
MVPLALLVLASAGCASIVSESRYPVRVTSNVPAEFEIRNEDGETVHTGTTPAQVSLDSASGYMDGETYTVEYHAPGYQKAFSTIQSSINGWYWGNIGFGGLIGWFLVDPSTGAMFKLPPSTGATLAVAQPQVPMSQSTPSLGAAELDPQRGLEAP